MGERRRQRHVPAHAGRHDRPRHLDRRRADCRSPAAGRTRSSSTGAGSRPRARGTGRPATTRTTTRARPRGHSAPYSAPSSRGGRSGPLRGVQVFESGVTSSGSNSFQTGTTPTLGLSLAVTGSLKVQSQATDPVVELRVTGSQNQSIDCDPAIPNLASEIEQGCGPAYKINPTPRLPRLQRALVASRALGVRQDADRRRGRPGRARDEGSDPRRRQHVHRADQLAELQRRRPAHRAADHHAVRQLRRHRQRHRARDRLRRLLRRRLERRPLPGRARRCPRATSPDISSSTRRRIRRGAGEPSATPTRSRPASQY